MESEKSGFGADIDLQSLRDATRSASRSNYLVKDTLFAELAKSFAPMIEEFHHRRSTCICALLTKKILVLLDTPKDATS